MFFVFGSYSHERPATTGKFHCPCCQSTATYQLFRTYRVSHFNGIPLGKRLDSERIACTRCNTALPITVLASDAPQVGSPAESGSRGVEGVESNLGNVVTLTEQAASEIRRRHIAGGYRGDEVVRVMPGRSRGAGYQVVFDYVLSDGRDWIGQSQGIPLVVSRSDAPILLGKTIDFRLETFCDAEASN